MLDFFDDDSMLGNKTVPFKLPNVGRPVSSISKPNGNFKLKPVVSKSTASPKEIMAKKPVIMKKLAPVAIPSPSNPPLAVRASKSVTGLASKSSDVKEPSISPRVSSSESQKTHVSSQIFEYHRFVVSLTVLMLSVSQQHRPKIWLHAEIVDASLMKNASRSTKVFVRNRKSVKCSMGAYIEFKEPTQKLM